MQNRGEIERALADLPLAALRAFEAAARLGGFTAAGAALGVSSAAVSQHVRGLEAHLGRRLFLRQGNRITLTDAGRTLYPRLGAAFAELATATRDLRDGPQRGRLVLSVLPSLAELWVIPVLAGFAGVAEVVLRVEEDPVRFGRDGVDLRLTYGGEVYADHLVTPLFSDAFVAVAAPGGPEAAALTDDSLIHTVWGASYGAQPFWAAWFAAAGAGRVPDPDRGLRVAYTAHAVAAAVAGLGAALVPARLAGAELRAGRLVRLEGPALPMRAGYVMLRPQATAARPSLRALEQHLLAQAQAGR